MPDEIITFGVAFDPSQIVRGTSQANRAFDRLQSSAKRMDDGFVRLNFATLESHRGFRQLERGVVTAGFALAGVQGPIGTLSRTMLLFGTGGGAGLLFAGALAAGSLALRALTEEANKAAKAEKDLLRAIT